MTNEERWQIEGRTREALREAKKNLASLGIEIEEHAKRLEEAAGSLRHFLTAATSVGPTGMTPRHYELHFLKDAIPDSLARRLEDYEAEFARVSDLEGKVKSFD